MDSKTSDPNQYYTLPEQERVSRIEEIVNLCGGTENTRKACTELAKWYRPFDADVLNVLREAASKNRLDNYVDRLTKYCNDYLSNIPVVKRTDPNRTGVKDAQEFLRICLKELGVRAPGTKTVMIPAPIQQTPQAKPAKRWYEFWK